MSEKSNDLLKGLLIGGFIGVVLGILYAPKSGKETRDDIVRTTEDLLSKGKEEYEKAVVRSKAVYEEAVKHLRGLDTSAKEKIEEIQSEASEAVHKGADVIADSKNRLKKAIDAGMEAYREENIK